MNILYKVTTEPECVGGLGKPTDGKKTDIDIGLYHSKITKKYRASLRSKLNMRNYPFDFQLLEIRLKSFPVHIEPYKLVVHFKNPRYFRIDEGHQLAGNCDW